MRPTHIISIIYSFYWFEWTNQSDWDMNFSIVLTNWLKLKSFLSVDINLFLMSANCPLESYLELEVSDNNFYSFILILSIACLVPKVYNSYFKGIHDLIHLASQKVLASCFPHHRHSIPACSVKLKLILNELSQKVVMSYHLTFLGFIFPFYKWQDLLLISNSTPVFLPRKSHGQRSLAGYSP